MAFLATAKADIASGGRIAATKFVDCKGEHGADDGEAGTHEADRGFDGGP